MEQYLGLFVAVEEYNHDAYFKKVHYAEEDATDVRKALVDLGCYEDRLEILLSKKATYATVKDRIRHICAAATREDTVIFYYAGHGIFEKGDNYITCYDTSQHDRINSSIRINDIIAQLQSCKSKRVLVFLDCCHSGIKFNTNERSVVSRMSYESLIYTSKDIEYLSVYSASKNDEPSHVDPERKHGIWSYFLIEALRGFAPPDVYEDRLLFSDKLQKYLLDETQNRSSLITEPKKVQTPMWSGSSMDRFIVADLSKLMSERALLAGNQEMPIKQTILIRQMEDGIRKLPGFDPFKHRAPFMGSVQAEKWVKRWGEDLVYRELVAVQEDLKNKLGFTRRQMPKPISVFDGTGSIDTTKFDYTVSIAQSRTDPQRYVLTHSISNFENMDLIRDPAFNALFGRIEELRIEQPVKRNVESIIDRLEALNSSAVRVEYNADDPSSCTIIFEGIDDTIRLTEHTLSLVAHIRTSPIRLVENFGKSLKELAAHGGLFLLGDGGKNG